MRRNNIPVYKMIIDPCSFITDLTNIDSVDLHAIERNFILLIILQRILNLIPSKKNA